MGLVGDENSNAGGLAVLFERHRAELLRFLAARCGDAGEAEDMLQDLWLKASVQPSGPIANARAYLFRMANNLVIDRRRAQQRAMRRDREWMVAAGDGDGLPEERPDSAPLADAELESRQEAEILSRAIAALPAGAQRALRLHRLEGYPQGEVAEIMGISRSGVEKHLAVAMKHLRKSLVNCGSDAVASSGVQGYAEAALPPSDQRP